MKSQHSPVVLASASPRRKEILSGLFPFLEVVPSGIPEEIVQGLSPEILSMNLAFQKSVAVASRYPEAFVIGADTLVVVEGDIMGKPRDNGEAESMLRMLSGKTHQVMTGTAVCYENETWQFYVTTEVCFYTVTPEEIRWYLDTKEPFDKAGGYGIQGFGARFIREIKGDYLNVVGFPLSALYQEMVRRGVPLSRFRNQG